jgi:hypothetical protein
VAEAVIVQLDSQAATKLFDLVGDLHANREDNQAEFLLDDLPGSSYGAK